MRFYTYILQSDVDASFYIGYTSNLSRRIEEHNSGLSKHTSLKTPWKLVYFEDFESKSEAIRREHFLKNMKNRDFITRLIQSLNSVS